MSKYSQGEFVPKNPKKIIGNAKIVWRSSWELYFMTFLDSSPNVLQWASESVSIKYINPLTGKQSQYIPDFLVLYIDKNGKQWAELVEIKPRKEAMLEHAKSRRDKAVLAINTAKWTSALAWCHKNGVKFRVITEDQLWPSKGKK